VDLSQEMEHSGEPVAWSVSRSVMPYWKRGMDVCAGVLGLLLLWPLFIAVGVFIKVVSPGPAFFRQERVGYRGSTFYLWKFRTMHPDTDTTSHQQLWKQLVSSDDAGDTKAMHKLDRDPRVILFGDFLRRSGLDEIPQLFNVLKGEMSLVGPRPALSYEVAHYEAWHMGRFNAMPGITGLWQVSGKNRLTFKEMADLDIAYGQNVSFWLDLKIILKTPLAILREFQKPGES